MPIPFSDTDDDNGTYGEFYNDGDDMKKYNDDTADKPINYNNDKSVDDDDISIKDDDDGHNKNAGFDIWLVFK